MPGAQASGAVCMATKQTTNPLGEGNGKKVEKKAPVWGLIGIVKLGEFPDAMGLWSIRGQKSSSKDQLLSREPMKFTGNDTQVRPSD